MTPEQYKRLSGAEFSVRLRADPELHRLKSLQYDRKLEFRMVLDAIGLRGGDRIGELPVLPLTAAKWAFLWALDNPLASGRMSVPVGIADLDVFLWVLTREDLRELSVSFTDIPVIANAYGAASGLEEAVLRAEINSLIRQAFAPLELLPPSGVENGEEEVHYDGSWLTWITSLAARESNLPIDTVTHVMPLSTVCWHYVNWRRRECVDGDQVRRRPGAELMAAIEKRIDEMAKEFLSEDSAGEGSAQQSGPQHDES